MTELIGIAAVMILPMIGIAWALYYSWKYSKEIGKDD